MMRLLPVFHAALLALALVALPGALHQARAEIADHTALLDIQVRSTRSDMARDMARGGYELADGQWQSFRDWYAPTLPEVTALFMTQIAPRMGVIWGLSTGERGEKYRIDPALHLGFVAETELARNVTLSVGATAVLGGRFRESACVADYGAFGSSPVNCRLAAGVIPPEETLAYLVNRSGWEDSHVFFQLTWRF